MTKRRTKIIWAIVVATVALLLAFGFSLRARYPNKYKTAIDDAAAEFGLSGSLVRAVVWTESRFDKNAVSEKGASGLMQIMPQTLDECAQKLGIQNPDPFDPETSLRCGCYYLSLMLKRFDGELDYALMAYNAGEANAKAFKSGKPVFAETKTYVKRVKKARSVYSAFEAILRFAK